MDSAGGSSSSRIVPSADPRPSAAPRGSDRTNANDSSGSSTSSSTIGTRIVRDTSPGANVSVPAALS